MTKSSENFRFAPAILQRLGEELNPHPDQGILELVKNAYDADARTCKVELLKTNKKGGTIRVSDNGDGMDRDQIVDGWLLLGKSLKTSTKPTRLGRLPVGNKGLGRLASLRMGNKVHLETKPRLVPQAKHELKIDWKSFDDATAVEDVPLTLRTLHRSKAESKGTCITITGLQTHLRRMDVKRLARSMVLLADPFDDQHGFQPVLVATEFRDLQKLVKNQYFADAAYRLDAAVDGNGKASATVYDPRGNKLFRASHSDLGTSKKRYSCPSARFELWAFLLDKKSFTPGGPTVTEVRDWLNAVGGVHVYHRGLRVHPYGDEGHDWLDMNLRRARAPEERPSTNTSVGRITIDDPGERLIQKTDRSGFVEDTAFTELRRFAQDALDWMARRRLAEREKRRNVARTERAEDVEKAKAAVSSAIEAISKTERQPLERVFRSYEKVRDQREQTLLEEVQLYRTLCTVGTTAATFAHESKKPLTTMARSATTVRSIAQERVLKRDLDDFSEALTLITTSANALKSFTELTLGLLQHDKRIPGQVDVHKTIHGVMRLLGPHFQRMSIATVVELSNTSPFLYGTEAALESILANLLTNAINAIKARRTQQGNRSIQISTDVGAATLTLEVADSGTGIISLDTEEMWLPGQTTTPQGTGLGLTIVRDAVIDLGGEISVQEEGSLGGAVFTVTLPRLEA